MIDPAIEKFFEQRKEDWRKKPINNSFRTVEEKENECEKEFSLEQWLPRAARRAGQISFSTHPCTFSHPSAKTNKNGNVSSFVVLKNKRADGYVRSGNVECERDALGNAAAMDVYKFLTLKMSDSRQMIAHIREDSHLAKTLLTIDSASYESLKEGFLEIETPPDEPIVTSSRIKQVYFPIEDGYHQLSILSPSGIIYELKNSLDKIRFSEETKILRGEKRENKYSEQSFPEIKNLTIISYGGSKPQNISVLNSQNRGKAYLLLSSPPKLKERTVPFPKKDFFQESLRYNEYKDTFNNLHHLFALDYNNINIRQGRDAYLQDLIDFIVQKVWAIRGISEEQYNPVSAGLKAHQKIWLYGEENERLRGEDWLENVCNDITRWIIRTYERLKGKQAYKFGEAERQHIHSIVTLNREGLR